MAHLIKRKYKNVDDELIQIIKSESLRITRLFGNFNYSPLQNMLNKTDENIHELIRFSLFKIKQLPNPIKIIECECKWSHLGTAEQQEFEPFLATSDDPETHGQQLYAALINGDHGSIAAEDTFYWWDESTSSVKNSSELTYG